MQTQLVFSGCQMADPFVPGMPVYEANQTQISIHSVEDAIAISEAADGTFHLYDLVYGNRLLCDLPSLQDAENARTKLMQVGEWSDRASWTRAQVKECYDLRRKMQAQIDERIETLDGMKIGEGAVGWYTSKNGLHIYKDIDNKETALKIRRFCVNNC